MKTNKKGVVEFGMIIGFTVLIGFIVLIVLTLFGFNVIEGVTDVVTGIIEGIFSAFGGLMPSG